MKTLTAKEAYLGSMTALAMAEAVYHEYLRSALCTSNREKVFLSAPRHSSETRQKFAKLAENAGKKLAELPAGSESAVIDDLLWDINFYSKSAKTGIDPWTKLLDEKVKAALVVRELKNEARRLKRLAFSLCKSEFDRQSLALATLTAPTRYDYKDWALGVVND